MRFNRLAAAAAAALLLPLAAQAQVPTQAPAPVQAQAPAPASPRPDPVLAKVDGEEIHLSDVSEAVGSLPPEYRAMPPQMIFPKILDQLISQKALVILARKQGLDRDPQVKAQMAQAAEQALQAAAIRKAVAPLVTEQAVQAAYDKDVAGRAPEEEIHARHILVANEADAARIIGELKKGGDFAALAKANSTDPGAASGGDLGWFKKADMLPDFSAAAFAMKPGEVSDKPVKTQYGWHVIKLEERRPVPVPAFAEARDELRQKMISEDVQKVFADARGQVKVEQFNPDGSVPKATDAAEPPPAIAPAPAKN